MSNSDSRTQNIEVLESLRSALADRYTIIRELGRGGMATVYLAEDPKHGRQVAIKVLHPELAATLGTERFLREIETAAQLSHPHILALHDSGETDGFVYFVMPYVQGESLRDRLDREDQLSIDEALAITNEIADALSYAHVRGIVHRDIKPENVLLSNGHAIVADFGIARAIDQAGQERLTETGLALGTPHYMSPEQARADEVIDGRSDQYALACVLYEMLAGAPPFTGPTPQAVLARHAADPVPSITTLRATVPSAIERATTRALTKTPNERFATVHQFAEALIDVREDAGWGARRRRIVIAATAAALMVIVAVAIRLLDSSAATDGAPDAASAALDPNKMLVFPFRTAAASPDVQRLGAAVPDMFRIALSGKRGLPDLVDPDYSAEHWNQLTALQADPSLEAEVERAWMVGAALLVSGAMVGTTDRITLSASITRVLGGQTESRSVSGPADDILQLVHQLALALLVGDKARTQDYESGTIHDVRPEALEAYLAARAAGSPASDSLLARALDLDSTFALAAALLWDSRSAPIDWQQRGRRLALQYRDRLSEYDRISIEVQAALQDAPNPHEQWRVISDAAERFPRNHYILNMFMMQGAWGSAARAGETDWGPRMINAWQRARLLEGGDSALHRDAQFGAGIAIWAGDLDRAEEIAQIAAQRGDPFYRLLWHRLRGDSAGAAAVWASGDDWCERGRVFNWYWPPAGLPLEDWERCIAVRVPSAVTRADRGAYLQERLTLALLRGQARQVVALNDSLVAEGLYPNARGMIRPLQWWLAEPVYEDAARRAFGVIDSVQGAWPDSIFGNWNNPWERRCFLSLWNVEHGDPDDVVEGIAWLRTASQKRYRVENAQEDGPDRDCPWLLEVLRERRLDPDGDAPLLNRLDSIMPTVGALPPTTVEAEMMNLMLARLWMERGEWEKAFAAAQRRQPQNPKWSTATFVPALRIDGLAAEALGDYDRAILKYSHYLDVRTHPDPGPLRDEWEDVRRRLGALLEREGRE